MPEPTGPRWRAHTWATPLAVAALAVGVVLRAVGLDNQSLWLDEYLAFSIGQQPLDVLLARAAGITGQLPAYYLVVSGWSRVFGEGDLVVVRWLSVVLGTIALVQLYALARRFLDAPRASLALAVAAVSPYQLYMSQEARMYPLFTCLVLGIAHLTLSLLRDPGGRRALRLAGLGALVATALYTHYYAVLFIAAIDLFVLLHWKDQRRAVLEIAGVQVAAALAYGFWIPALLHAAQSGGNAFFQFATLKGFYTTLVFSLGYSSVIVDSEAKQDLIGHFFAHGPKLALAGAVFGTLAFLGARNLWKHDRKLLWLVLLVLGLPIVVATTVSFFLPIISDRYFAPGAAFYALLLGCGIWEAPRILRWALVGLALLLTAQSLHTYYFDPRFGHEDWRAAAAYIDEQGETGDEILLFPDLIRGRLGYYTRVERPTHLLIRPSNLENLPGDGAYWLVVSHGLDREEPVVRRLDERFVRVDRHFLPRGEGIELFRYKPRGPQR